MAKISVILASARDDFSLIDLPTTHLFQPTVESLQKQIFRDWELVVVDGLHSQRKGFFDGVGFPVKHLPPKNSPYLEKGYWAICDFLNTAVIHAEGELIVKIDDACEFSEDYLQRIWDWHTVGAYPLSLVNYYRGGEVARYDELTRQYLETIARTGSPLLEGDPTRRMEILDRMYKAGQAIEDSRLKLMKSEVVKAPWTWAYGYVAVPLDVILDLNGWDESFDQSKSLDDVDFGLRVSLSGRERFVIDNMLWAVENFHGPVSEKVVWNRGRPAKCNHSIMRLHQKSRIFRVNTREFTQEELEFIRKETRRAPCSHVRGADYGTNETFDWWASQVPEFDLKKMREEVCERA